MSSILLRHPLFSAASCLPPLSPFGGGGYFIFTKPKSMQNSELTMQIAELKDAMREIYEVWAGSDGFDVETGTEKYALWLIIEMRDIAAKHME